MKINAQPIQKRDKLNQRSGTNKREINVRKEKEYINPKKLTLKINYQLT